MRALLEAREQGKLAAEPVLVFSNKAKAKALTVAQSFGVPTEYLSHKDFASREDFDAKVVEILKAHDVELVVLAGYMRIVTPTFLAPFHNRVINIHPALLPAFPGTDGIRQAYDYGVKVAGCTVHFVDDKVDHGPIISQKALAVHAKDTVDSLAQRVLALEHEALVEAVNWVASGRVVIDGRRVVIVGA